jgi:hypothetical protein
MTMTASFSIGFTASRAFEQPNAEIVYVGPRDEQLSSTIPVTMVAAGVDVAMAADSEDLVRANHAMPLYRAAFQAEGLHQSE